MLRRWDASRVTQVACAGATVAIGALGLVRWILGGESEVGLAPGFTAMPPLSGVALAALGSALLLFSAAHPRRRLVLLWSALTLLALGIGALAVFVRALDVPAGELPSLGAGLSIVPISSGILLARRRRPFRGLASALLGAGAVIPGVALNAYTLVASEDLHRIGAFADVSLLTSAGLFLAALGAVTMGGRRGLLPLLWSDTLGGWLARRVLPGLLLVPGVTSWVVHAGTTLGLYSSELERSLSVVAVSIVIGLVFWLAALRINGLESGRRTAERLSWTDPLTTLANRRGLERRLAVAQEAADQHGEPYSVVAIDADGLKSVNDRLGHGAGDAVIRTIAQGLLAELRPLDLAARVGGDEFLVLLADSDDLAAAQAARRIGAAVDLRLTKPHLGGVSVSTGVGTWSSGLDGATVVAAADRALYEAKRKKSPAGATA